MRTDLYSVRTYCPEKPGVYPALKFRDKTEWTEKTARKHLADWVKSGGIGWLELPLDTLEKPGAKFRVLRGNTALGPISTGVTYKMTAVKPGHHESTVTLVDPDGNVLKVPDSILIGNMVDPNSEAPPTFTPPPPPKLPERFEVRDPDESKGEHCGSLIVKDKETGREVEIAGHTYHGVRDVLIAFFS